jgi:hypothetical protein
MHEMLVVVVESKPSMPETTHATAMCSLAGKQSGSAWGARRSGAEGVAEEYAFLSEMLQVRRRDGVAVRLNMTASVVRMEINNVGSVHGTILS